MASAFGGEAILDVKDVLYSVSGVGEGDFTVYTCPASRYAKVCIYHAFVSTTVTATTGSGVSNNRWRLNFITSGSYLPNFLFTQRTLTTIGTASSQYEIYGNDTWLERSYILLPTESIENRRSKDAGGAANYASSFYAKIFEYAKP